MQKMVASVESLQQKLVHVSAREAPHKCKIPVSHAAQLEQGLSAVQFRLVSNDGKAKVSYTCETEDLSFAYH